MTKYIISFFVFFVNYILKEKIIIFIAVRKNHKN
ncbi:hypothetical protein SLY_0427 [Strawberry lethal yellows phytoplasma (CPA) str. NZSb11]|uniref:Uncharacterized protein n=1 Tax=Strawberry lethal yellows phytoplasma (CPA) str. NZSb11 TaxID=980422 RepID=R4RPD8_PHYAS|nr:hypothetical protein SLY_0427 [Strawberry lethal yellows phytoplasma (CPA) str. NZSb11]